MHDVRATWAFKRRRARTALALSLVCVNALADGGAILACRQIADPAQRFKCYESIDVAPVATPRPPASQPRQASAESFGLEHKAVPSPVQSIESSIVGRFYGWDPDEKITLANGQVWQISDDSRGAVVALDPKVKIRRGALGAFYLEIEGTNRSPRVRRSK